LGGADLGKQEPTISKNDRTIQEQIADVNYEIEPSATPSGVQKM
jgi:hypothetical protein